MPALFDTGFSVRQPMWHRQGTVLEENPTDWSDARTKAGLTWEPVELTPYFAWPLSTFDICCSLCLTPLDLSHEPECERRATVTLDQCLPEGAYVVGEQVMVPDRDHKGIARPDTRLILGVRTDDYSTIYHGRRDDTGTEVTAAEGRASMEEIIDAFRGDGVLKFETAGSLAEGRKVWALFYLDEPFTVPGDDTEHLPFLALLNDHTGAGGCKAIDTMVRVVCWNTYHAAEADAERRGHSFTFRHVGDVASRIDEAKAAVAGLRTERDQYLEMAEELSKLTVGAEDFERFSRDFLPSPEEHGEVISDRVRNNIDKARKMFKSIYLDSVTTDAVRGTGFGLLSAGTEYLDHIRAYRSRDSFMGRSILGTDPAKAKLLTLVREHAH